jgi:hypothetical protein
VASVPDIGPFDRFHTIIDNPFIPWREREIERNQITKPKNPTPQVFTPPTPPVIVNVPEKPKLVLPRLAPAKANAPVCVGMVGQGDQRLLMVRLPDDAAAAPLAIGQCAGGWTLLAIENDNQARFRDPDGMEQVFPIGSGDLAVVPSAPTTAATTAPAKPASAPPGQVGHGESLLLKRLNQLPRGTQLNAEQLKRMLQMPGSGLDPEQVKELMKRISRMPPGMTIDVETLKRLITAAPPTDAAKPVPEPQKPFRRPPTPDGNPPAR